MTRDSLNPQKSDLVELYENSGFKFIEIDVDSTSNWNTSGNIFVTVTADALSWNMEKDFDLLCVEEVIKNMQGGLIFISVIMENYEEVAREYCFWVMH